MGVILVAGTRSGIVASCPARGGALWPSRTIVPLERIWKSLVGTDALRLSLVARLFCGAWTPGIAHVRLCVLIQRKQASGLLLAVSVRLAYPQIVADRICPLLCAGSAAAGFWSATAVQREFGLSADCLGAPILGSLASHLSGVNAHSHKGTTARVDARSFLSDRSIWTRPAVGHLNPGLYPSGQTGTAP